MVIKQVFAFASFQETRNKKQETRIVIKHISFSCSKKNTKQKIKNEKQEMRTSSNKHTFPFESVRQTHLLN